jgi:hypothetical protein
MKNTILAGTFIKITDHSAARPTINGLPLNEEVVFYGLLRDGEYCIITIDKEQIGDFKKLSCAFGEEDDIKATFYHGTNFYLYPSPVTTGYKITDSNGSSNPWFCRTNITNIEIENEITLSCRDEKHFFNGRTFEKVFSTI